MLLSIITPTLNPGPRLAHSIQSVLDQRVVDLEHLIVDGGSTDGTLELISGYKHLRVVSDGDEGIFDAMNKGVAAAKGKWLYFLGADDVLVDPSVLSDLKKYFESDFNVVYGDVVSTRFSGKYDGPFDAVKIRRKNICHQAIFFRREVFERIGTFNPIYRSHADWDHNMRWLLDPKVTRKYVDRAIAIYADHGFSSLNPDPMFEKDRLFRYLQYGKSQISLFMYAALLTKELLLSVQKLDAPRVRRALQLATGS